MAICVTSLRMFMRHSELRQVCRQVSCGSFWKRTAPATPLLMTEWISRRQAYCTNQCDDPLNSGQKTNKTKASQSEKNASPKNSTSSQTSAANNITTKTTEPRKTTATAQRYDRQSLDTKSDTTNAFIDIKSSESESFANNSANSAPSQREDTATKTHDEPPERLTKDIARMKLSQLKDELRAHGLSVGGTKNILIERLQNYLQYQKQLQQQQPESSQNTENVCDEQIANVTQPTEAGSEATLTAAAVLPKPTPTTKPDTTRVPHNPSSDSYPTSRVASAPATATATSSYSRLGRSNSDTDVSDINHSTISAASADSDSCQKHGMFKVQVPTLCDGPNSIRKCNSITTADVCVEYVQGLPHFTIPLPSRNERCRFVLKPVTHYVGDLIDMLRTEDRGIDRAVVLNEAGVRISSTCNIESLLDAPFWLHINDQKYKVTPPKRDRILSGDIDKLGDIRVLVAQLYEALNVGEYYLNKENEMTAKLEDLKYKVAPLERKFDELNVLASRKSGSLMWVGLGLMSVQFGVLARLTWWEYSWDIMEPVTYFVTYGTTMAAFAYYCITKTEYNMPEVKERQYLLDIHKRAKRANFDIDSYNTLKRQIAEVEYDLRRLKDPLNMQLPPHVDRSQEHRPAGLYPPKEPPSSTLSASSTPATTSTTRQPNNC